MRLPDKILFRLNEEEEDILIERISWYPIICLNDVGNIVDIVDTNDRQINAKKCVDITYTEYLKKNTAKINNINTNNNDTDSSSSTSSDENVPLTNQNSSSVVSLSEPDELEQKTSQEDSLEH